MLSIHPQDVQRPGYLSFSSLRDPQPSAFSLVSLSNMGEHHFHPHHPSNSTTGARQQPQSAAQTEDTAITQALEIARESPDGARDPTVSSILESALKQIWSKVQKAPDSYVMSRDEFAVFNFFQQRFVGDKLAIAARKRYWDNTRV